MAKFLIVEDNKNARETLLNSLGYSFKKDQFIGAGSYQETLKAIAREGNVTHIISDIDGCDGFDLYAYVTQQHPEIVFSFLSGRNAAKIQEILEKRGLAIPKDQIFGKEHVAKQGAVYIESMIRSLKRKLAQATRPPEPISNIDPAEDNLG